MRGTPKQIYQEPASNLAEEALGLTINIAPLDAGTLKVLRLTCKLTKAAADLKVCNFTLSVNQEPVAVQRSGLLKHVTKLQIDFYLMQLMSSSSSHARNLSRAFGLLHLAVGACSKSLEVLDFKFRGSPDILLASASILGNSNWESLQQLTMGDSFFMTGCLCGILARPSSLPALKELWVSDPTTADLELVVSSAFIGSLTDLTLHWYNASAAGQVNAAPATVAAMRNFFTRQQNWRGYEYTAAPLNFSIL